MLIHDTAVRYTIVKVFILLEHAANFIKLFMVAYSKLSQLLYMQTARKFAQGATAAHQTAGVQYACKSFSNIGP